MRLALPLVLLLAAPACTSSQAMLITADSVDAAGSQFVETSDAMIKAVDQGTISAEQFKGWNEFSKRFALFYRPTVRALKAARTANDAALAGELGAAISSMTAELGGWFLVLVKAGVIPPKGGTP